MMTDDDNGDDDTENDHDDVNTGRPEMKPDRDE
jgi:hypothetical protein